MRNLRASMLVLLTVTIAQAQPPAPLPAGAPTVVCLAKAQLKDGAVELQLMTPQLVPEQRQRVVERNGLKVTEKYLVHVPVAVERRLRVDNKAVRVTTKAGKDVEVGTL